MSLAFLGLTGVGFGALCGLVYAKQDALVFFPSPVVSVDPGELGLDFESFEIPLARSTVTGWIVRSPKADAPWMLHFHGNGGNVASNIGYLAFFQKVGCNGVVFDYRRYGRSRGVPSELGLIDDAKAVRTYLLEEQKVAPERLIYFGESLGGGVACALAAEYPPAGLILKSTFTSVPARAAEIYPFLPVRWLSRTRLDSASRIATISCPKLFLHGQGDQVVPYHHGRKLYDLAAQPKTWLDISGDHNTGPLELGRDFSRAVEEFAQQARQVVKP